LRETRVFGRRWLVRQSYRIPGGNCYVVEAGGGRRNGRQRLATRAAVCAGILTHKLAPACRGQSRSAGWRDGSGR